MKRNERRKVQELIDRIQVGNFDELDIDNIFLKLRGSARNHPPFREIADLVAHCDIRSKGLMHSSLETFSLRMKYFGEYNSPGKPLDLSSPIPIWVKRLLLLQTEQCTDQALEKCSNLNRKKLKKKIDKEFRDDKGNQTTYASHLSSDTVEGIRHVLGFISGGSPISQAELVTDLISICKENDFTVDQAVLESQSDRITLTLLLLLHNTEFDVSGRQSGECRIHSERNLIVGQLNESGKFLRQEIDGNDFGRLSILGTVYPESNSNVGKIGVAQTLLTTELETAEWCEDNLFKIQPISDAPQSPHALLLELDCEVELSGRFQLTRAEP